MRLIFLGDVLGKSGRDAVALHLPQLRARFRPDCVVVNGENATHGFGLSADHYALLRDAGADVVTLGNHSWDQKEALVFIERQDRLLRPINYPKGTPGKGAGLFRARNGADVLVINAMGLIFMPELDCPFRATEEAVEACGLKRGADVILVDFHAEATSEKQAVAAYLDGRVTCVVGTHTHVPTSDYRVLPGGTAFMCDIGMCGDYDSVLGMGKEEPINRFLTKIARGRFEPANGPATVSGLAVEVDDATGLATRVAPVRVGGVLAPALPSFWE